MANIVVGIKKKIINAIISRHFTPGVPKVYLHILTIFQLLIEKLKCTVCIVGNQRKHLLQSFQMITKLISP